jgi:YD repeat-containing protein
MQATYTHDNLGRLTLAVFDNGTQVSYSYDAVGNRTSVVRVGSLATTDGDPSQCELRASLTQNDPWGLADVSNGSILYFTPIYDGRVGIWNGSATYSLKAVPFSINLAVSVQLTASGAEK